MRTDPPVPPTGNVPSQWEAQKKWRVESIKAPKSTDRSYRVLNRTMVVTPSKSARPRLAMTTFKAFRRRKQHGLVLNQVLTARKKMNKLKKKASNPLVNCLFFILLCVIYFKLFIIVSFFQGNGCCSTSTCCAQPFPKYPGKGGTHGSSN